MKDQTLLGLMYCSMALVVGAVCYGCENTGGMLVSFGATLGVLLMWFGGVALGGKRKAAIGGVGTLAAMKAQAIGLIGLGIIGGAVLVGGAWIGKVIISHLLSMEAKKNAQPIPKEAAAITQPPPSVQIAAAETSSPPGIAAAAAGGDEDFSTHEVYPGVHLIVTSPMHTIEFSTNMVDWVPAEYADTNSSSGFWRSVAPHRMD